MTMRRRALAGVEVLHGAPEGAGRERGAAKARIGQRQRGAIGMPEESDAAVIVVSEEDGTISLARNGELQRGLSPEDLLGILVTMV